MIKKLLKLLFYKCFDMGFIHYKYLEEPYFFIRPNRRRIKDLKNKFKGERCFIIGNGPSLNQIDIKKLNNEYTFGVNGIFYKTQETGFVPYFYVVEDTSVMVDNCIEINKFDTPYKFFPTMYKNYIDNKSDAIFFNMNRGFYEERSPNYCMPRFSMDCSEKIYCGQSVTIMNLQLAYYMGFKEIYLVGMDFSYKIPDTAIVKGKDIISTEDDVNHFHPDYFGKGKSWHDPHLDNVLMNYKMAKIIFEYNERKIINATVGGKLEVFPRVDFNTLF
jgi:hypothetical protein